MKILLTGGTGLVGSDLRETLLKKGHVVYATSRNQQESNNPNLSWIKIDFDDIYNNTLRNFPKVDVVIHNAAAIDSNSLECISSLSKTNILFTEQLLTWVVKKHVKTFLMISSFSFIQKPLPDIINEESSVAPQSFYSMSKYWGELLVNEYSKKHDFKKIILRIPSPICFDLDRLPNNVVKKMISAGLNQSVIKVFGQGNRKQNFVSTTDIAEVVAKIINKEEASGIYSVASLSALSMKELAQLIAHKFKTTIEYTGVDPLENENWNISSEKLSEIGIQIKLSSREVIVKLLESFN